MTMFGGLAYIKKNTSTHSGMGIAADFEGKLLTCTEINQEGDVMVFKEEVGLAMFAACDVLKSCRLSMINGFYCPPNLNEIQRKSWYLLAVKKSNNDPKTFNIVFGAMSVEKGEAMHNFFELKSELSHEQQHENSKEESE